ncbi:hypothetical protein jhhlp_002788 [Lomentospora prolificans]|uniref:Methyltransferase type 11 domain-containing protein n=1 Tax=Lomentospora prolificans TaxID=41688 RepID=A0A2N3NF25_9PEZI|nr:hypothetical protein jhhlp_002788 [Lomentospora prolificans]
MSQRLGPSPAIKPGNAPPSMTRRLVGYRSNSDELRTMPRSLVAPRDQADPRKPGQNAKEATRIPQHSGTSSSSSSSSTRRPSLPSQPTRPRLTQQGHSYGSISSASARSASYQSSSGSSLPCNPKDTGFKAAPGVRRKRSSLTPNSENLRNNSRTDSTRTSSSSSYSNGAGRSRSSMEPANGLHLDRALTESPTELRTAKAVDLTKPTTPTVTIYPELDRYRNFQQQLSEGRSFEPMYKLSTHDLPPPTPGYISGTGSQLSAMSGSPSTRFSESPGPGPYSRDTTPTSMTSQSPGLVAPRGFAPPRLRQGGSPAQTRPPVTRRRGGSLSGGINAINADPDGLAAVRESLTSSSSNSTVRGTEKKIIKKKLQAPPLSPPPRKSSSKQTAVKASAPEPSWRLSRGFSKSNARSPSPTKPRSATRHMQTLSPRATPPTRPSRDGTPDMQSQLWEPVPVIHSNLSSASLGTGERRGSEPHVSALPRSTTPSSNPRRPSTQDTAAVTRANSSNTTKISKPDPTRPTRTPSPNVSTFNSRFNFFSRKKTSTTEVNAAAKKDKSDKNARKGPAAGTGHEGYGRLGSIRRRSSGVLNYARPGPGFASSQESLTNQPQFSDPFLRDRMNPVIISGGEIIENRNTSAEFTRSDSNQSFVSHSRQRSNDSKFSSEMSTTSAAQEDRNTVWPSAFGKATTVSTASTTRRPSESSDDEGLNMKRTLAFRRSQQKLRTSPEQTPMRLPKPINTRGIAPSPLTSVETHILTDDSTLELQKETSRGRKLSLPQPKKLTKRAKSPRKWNLFSRSQSQATASKEPKVEVAATVKVVQTKSVPFYAMMDSSEQEDSGDLDVMEVLRSAEVYDQGLPHIPEAPKGHEWPSPATKSPEPAVIGSPSARPYQSSPPPEPQPHVASPPKASRSRIASPQEQPREQAIKATAPAKQSRLPQVGRIPKVVSTRPEQQTSPKSFSRPFNRLSFQAPKRTSGSADGNSSITGSSNPNKVLTPDLTTQESTVTSGSREFSPDIIGAGKEFLAFSPRKDSVATTSSSSCASATYTMADTTAIIPSPSAPLAEDEIWDEYNDLIGDVSFKGLASATYPRTMTLPIKYRASKGSVIVPESPTIIIKPPRELPKLPPKAERKQVVSSVYSCDDYDDDDDDAGHLEVPIAEASPTTPFSVSKFVEGYGDRNNSAELSATRVDAESQRNSGASRKSGRSSGSSCSKASEEETPLAQVNLRVGSMTVSKWLTFGHVLFSPAREELALEGASRENNSILVIDGLGNDDWSFYAAETYPGASFFNLSPRAPIPEDRRASTTFPLSPSNHYQIQYTSHLGKFPFGPETFTSVVFRFPQAAPESHYRNIISEAHRVLKPGGYIELSILDVDLNNMGNRGRRTVRRLKERIHARNADMNLASTADLMVRLLGKKHFADIKTCRVGVPVASSITRAKSARAASAEVTSSRCRDKGKGKAKVIGEQRSLAEMMNDDSEMADESIAKMVSKVGRWWYSRCYESVATPAAGAKKTTIWSDKPLMEDI